MPRAALRSAAILTALAVATPAFAWGPQGHRVIAKVAEDRLSPAAKAAVRDLLHDGDTLADVANWADHEGHDAVPASASWHFINVPIATRTFEGREVRGDGNVIVKIKQYRKVLDDKTKPKAERSRALLFLGHFVADVHQPMHVGDNNDRGGNLTQVQFFGEGTNLHRVWDSDLIRHIGGNDRAWVDRVERAITPAAVKAWSGKAVDDWADESLQAAKLAYRATEGAPKAVPSGVVLGPDYLKRTEPILLEQMARASVRLADELNAIFPGTGPPGRG